MGKRKTHEEFIEELKEKNPEAYEELEFLEDYKGKDKKTKALTKYGEVLIRPNSLLQGQFISIKSAIDKTEYFKNMLKEKKPEVYSELEFLEEYKSNKKKIKALTKYGEVYVKPNELLQGYFPSINLAIDKVEYFKNMLKEKNLKAYNELEFLEEYMSDKKKIKVLTKYGETCIRPNSLLRGQFPSINSAIDKNEYFANMAEEIHGNKYRYDKIKYKGVHTKIEIYCNKCKEYFWQTPNSHLNGSGCSNCFRSKGEEEVERHLLKNNTNFEAQKTFDNCKYKKLLRFDFYLPDYNICIEFDGIQHFQPTQFAGMSSKYAEKAFVKTKKNDSIKNRYCEDNGIKLIRIPYTEFDNIEEILEKELF